MSRTLRQSKHGKVRDGKKNNDFCMKHDITPIHEGENQSFREEEKQYFKKYKDTKYAQKPKSKGGSW